MTENAAWIMAISGATGGVLVGLLAWIREAFITIYKRRFERELEVNTKLWKCVTELYNTLEKYLNVTKPVTQSIKDDIRGAYLNALQCTRENDPFIYPFVFNIINSMLYEGKPLAHDKYDNKEEEFIDSFIPRMRIYHRNIKAIIKHRTYGNFAGVFWHFFFRITKRFL